MMKGGRVYGMFRAGIVVALWFWFFHQTQAQQYAHLSDSTLVCYQLVAEGNACTIRHQRQEALTCYQKAFLFATRPGEQLMIHQNIGCLYYLASEYDKATLHFFQAIQLTRELPAMDQDHLKNLYMNLASSFIAMNKPDQAKKWLQQARVGESDSSFLMSLRLALLEGNIALNTGEKRTALRVYNKPIGSSGQLLSELPEEIWLRKNIACCFQELSMLDSAIFILNQLVDQVVDLDPDHPLLPELLYFSGHLAMEANHLSSAAGLFEEGMRRLDQQQRKNPMLAGSTTMIRYRLRASKLMVHYYMKMAEIDGCMPDSNWLLEANALLELGEQYAQTVDKRNRVWVNRILQKSVYRMMLDQLWQVQPLKDKPDDYFMRIAEKAKIFNQNIRKNGHQEPFYIHKQLVSSLSIPDDLSLMGDTELFLPGSGALSRVDDASEQVTVFLKSSVDFSLVDVMKALREEEVILDFFGGQSAIYAYLITSSDAYCCQIRMDQQVKEVIDSFQKAIKTGDYPGFVPFSKLLYSQFVQPFDKWLAGKNQLLIFPDENLFQLPFDALMNEQGNFHMLFKEVTYHSSLSTWYQHRLEFMGDYSSRLDSIEDGTGYSCDFYGFSPRMVDCPGYQPLAEAAREVSDLVNLFETSGRNVCRNGQEPMDEITLIHDLRKARIIHLALHGEENRENPELSGWILFNGSPQFPGVIEMDGKLEMGELQQFNLHTELLTLSSCGVGVNAKNSWYRFTGFPFNFLDAGVKHLLFSAWNVSDKHTRILMNRFYDAYLDGVSFASALQKAKRSMLNSPKTANPTLWASWMLWTE